MVCQGIIQAADDVIAAIDQVELAVYLAQKCPEEGPGAAKRKKGEGHSSARGGGCCVGLVVVWS